MKPTFSGVEAVHCEQSPEKVTTSGGSMGGQRGPRPPRHFSAPFNGPPLFKEDVMSFLDFLILYRGKSLVSTSGPLVVWLFQEAKYTAKGFQLWEVLKLSIIIIIN